jgi:hypothetical protein
VFFYSSNNLPHFGSKTDFKWAKSAWPTKNCFLSSLPLDVAATKKKRCRLYLVPVVSSRQYAPRKNRSRAPVVSCAPAASMMLILDSSFVLPQAFPWLLRTYLSFIDRVDCWMPCPYYHRNPLFAQSLAERPSRSCGRSTQFLARRS